MDKRSHLAHEWLKEIFDNQVEKIERASEDASFRRYFRVSIRGKTYILMDAPPDLEPLPPFIKVCEKLRELGVHAPEIIKRNVEHGFLLLEDLGNRTYLPELAYSSNTLYSKAIKALVSIQAGTEEEFNKSLPVYDEEFLRFEMGLFVEWYVEKHLDTRLNSAQQSVWEHTQQTIVEACIQQPQVLVHRDFHSRNLMITDSGSTAVIDFQDMLVGPIAYDLASLFKDCYIEWPIKEQHKWLREYYDLAKIKLPDISFGFHELIRWYDLTGMQRHLKVLGVFSRLNYRDKKDQYLNDLPLVEKYIFQMADHYPELNAFGVVLSSLKRSHV